MMSVLSVIRGGSIAKRLVVHQMQQQRFAGHGNTMTIYPSRFQWNKFKDMLHFYTMVGLIPVTLLVGYVNLFIGRAELADTPKDFTPAFWEFERHPISRWIARYLFDDPIRNYELRVAEMARENDRRLIMLAGDEVRRKMIENNDYKAWYFRSFPHAGTARYNKTKVESHKHQIPIEPQV